MCGSILTRSRAQTLDVAASCSPRCTQRAGGPLRVALPLRRITPTSAVREHLWAPARGTTQLVQRAAATEAVTEAGQGTPLQPGGAPAALRMPPLPSTSELPGGETVEAGGRSFLQTADASDSSLQARMVQWYPGHIARAERQLKEQLGMVDVVLEVRDARIPVSTSHPQVPQWVGAKARVLVMNRSDEISPADRAAWDAHLRATGQMVFWTDGKKGDGVKKVRAALLRLAVQLNAKRAKRMLQPRAVRACVIGFPNIGKSALINRLLGRRVVESAPKPGVTRMLRWVRVDKELELLDAPGVIPARFNDQIAAQRLAMCNDIGEAAYLSSAVAACMVLRIKQLLAAERAAVSGSSAAAATTAALAAAGTAASAPRRASAAAGAASGRTMAEVAAMMLKRYGVDLETVGSSEDFIVALAERSYHGEVERAGLKLLNDYRQGTLGRFALELPGDIRRKAERDAALSAAAASAAAAADAEEDGRGRGGDGDDEEGGVGEDGWGEGDAAGVVGSGAYGEDGGNSDWVAQALASQQQQQQQGQ